MKRLNLCLLGLLAGVVMIACKEKEPDVVTPSDYVESGGDMALGMSMVYVQGGEFMMGTAEELGEEIFVEDEMPIHKVKLSSYYIGKYEVTQAQYRAVMGENPSFYRGDSLRLPVEMISWAKAKEFCEKLSAKTGKKYMLPTEAQWEFAAKGGVKSKGYKYSGSDDLDAVAWHRGNSGDGTNNKTFPVGSKAPNELGIYDMCGNVWEWCSDWYKGDYYQEAPNENPAGPDSGENRSNRGGGVITIDYNCRVANRDANAPDFIAMYLGFRVVCLAE